MRTENFISENITVIIPVFNEEKYIIKCIDSIIKTGIKKIIIEDANSQDKTIELIKNYKSNISIKLFTNNYQKMPYDSLRFLISQVNTKWYYFIGADDTLDANTFTKAASFIQKEGTYFIPLMEFYSEIKQQSLGKFPSSEWFKRINSAKRRIDIIKTCLDFCTLDVSVLGVHKKSTISWVYKYLTLYSKEGINFWQVLTLLLENYPKTNVQTSDNVSMIKIFDQIHPSGDQHPNNKRKIRNNFLIKAIQSFRSCANIFILSIRFRFSLAETLLLLTYPRGNKVKNRKPCDAPIPIRKIIEIFK